MREVQSGRFAESELERRAWTLAHRACEAAGRVEQLEWPVRTKLLCRLLIARDAS